MDKPPTPQIQATDPALTAAADQAQQDHLKALQVEAQGDTASLMARYGTRLALAGAMSPSGSPLMGMAATGRVG